MKVSRRDLLKGLGCAGLVGGLSQFGELTLAAATEPRENYFVLLNAFGGMDVTLGLDPWLKAQLPDEKDMFVEYRPDEVIQAGSNIFLGPSAEPIAKFASNMAVINGVFLSQVDNGHTASDIYMRTGDGKGLSPALPAELAVASDAGPFGVLSNGSVYTGTRKVTTGDLKDLKALPDLPDQSKLLETLFDWSKNRTDYMRAVRSVVTSRGVTQDFIARLKYFSDQGITELESEHVLAAAFLSKASYYAELNLPTQGNLDTHANHPGSHINLQRDVWTKVAEIFDLFKSLPYGNQGESLFDRTTFLVTSEFARTPALNTAQGKDHNPLTNSVLLAGYGVRGDQSIGASRLVTRDISPTGKSYHIAYPIDFKSGEVLYSAGPEASMIFPENIMKTVSEVVGVNKSRFRSVPADTKVIPGIRS